MYSIIVPKLDKTSSRIQIDFEFWTWNETRRKGDISEKGNRRGCRSFGSVSMTPLESISFIKVGEGLSLCKLLQIKGQTLKNWIVREKDLNSPLVIGAVQGAALVARGYRWALSQSCCYSLVHHCYFTWVHSTEVFNMSYSMHALCQRALFCKKDILYICVLNKYQNIWRKKKIILVLKT